VAGASAASVPPCPSVLPPGAGNKEEPEKALEAGKQRAKKIERGYELGLKIAERHVDAAAIGADDDGDAASIPTLEQIQATVAPTRPVRRRVRAV
jgi:hypothetical protein